MKFKNTLSLSRSERLLSSPPKPFQFSPDTLSFDIFQQGQLLKEIKKEGFSSFNNSINKLKI